MATTMHTNSIRIPFNVDFNLLQTSPVNCPQSVASGLILRRSRPPFSGIPYSRAYIFYLFICTFHPPSAFELYRCF